MNAPRSSPVPTPSPDSSPRSNRTTWIIGGAIALVVLVAGIVAIVSSSGDDDTTVVEVSAAPAATAPAATETPAAPAAPAVTEAPAATDASTSTDPASTLQQTQPVTVTGATLPTLSDDEAVGATAPTVSGFSFDGTPVTIAPGRPTLVVFLAHWCPHCQREVPALVQWAADGGVPDGLDVIGVATATTEQRDNYPPSDWLAREGWPWPVMADSSKAEALIALGGDAFPFFVLLDADGTVVARQSGELDPSDLTDAIARALA